ncbi:hypothetical protein K445DRAFT_318431 [Daldinia sp. EC12]|nr:hypothetical protein K445DRAFT_318431 [Daldinia sp. EC12]
MDVSDNGVKYALSLIEAANLPHPSGRLLESFVTEALYPVLAAQYVKKRLQLGEASSLVDDWLYIINSVARDGHAPPEPNVAEQRTIRRRDGGRCCVTGKAGTLRDPLIVAPILPVPHGWDTEKPGINDMLGAFFGPPYRDWWLSYIRDPEYISPYCNHWLIRKSVARAFALGVVRLNRLHPSFVEYELKQEPIGPADPIKVDGVRPLLGDHSRSGTPKVHPCLVGTQARLSRSTQYLELYQKLASEAASQHSQISTGLSEKHPNIVLRNRWSILSILTVAFFTVWCLVPSKIRVSCYKALQKLGERLYGRNDDYHGVQKLPFGLCLKWDTDIDLFHNEANALDMIRQHTTIPVPKVLDMVNDLSSPWPQAYLLTTRGPGSSLERCHDVLLDKDIERIAAQLKDYIAQLRDIPRSVCSDTAICNTLGDACRDPRILSADPIGPFADEVAFSQMLRFSDDPARRGHKIVFTHANIRPCNILVDQIPQLDGSMGWSVTGIVNWEFAGYYPEYWDYTKAMMAGAGMTCMRRYSDLMRSVFGEFGDYSREFDVEETSWGMLKDI